MNYHPSFLYVYLWLRGYIFQTVSVFGLFAIVPLFYWTDVTNDTGVNFSFSEVLEDGVGLVALLALSKVATSCRIFGETLALFDALMAVMTLNG